MKSRNLFAAAILLNLFFVPFSLQTQEEAAIRQVFDAVVDALRSNDLEGYIVHLHPDMTIFLPEMDRLGTKAADPESIRDGFSGRRVLDIVNEDVQISQLGNTALITAFQVGKETWDGDLTWEGKRKFSSMYVKDGGKWKVYHIHISTIVE